ncbi:MAG: PTPA-CTERM sorting domain-containing protein [Tildeniella nuda ZEHNDER 1965/U140]|jgi:hypothetical protein|nr:PTPA-CTERM sorting domain-containing protein [Tildeniella nuda ZEHNDER 1965/U140]
MNFKSIVFKATVAAAAVAGSTLGAASVQAASVSSNLNFTGSVSITQTGTAFNFDFLPNPGFAFGAADGDIEIGANSGLFAEAVGGAKIKDVSTDQSTLLPNFITGLLYDGDNVTFSLTKVTASVAGVFSSTGFNFFTFDGFFTDGSGIVLGNGAVSAQFAQPTVSGTTTFSGSITPVPTPALLPGLIALGVGVLRKRRVAAAEKAELNT